MDEDDDSDGGESGALSRSAQRQQSTWSLLVSALFYSPAGPGSPQADRNGLGGSAWQVNNSNANRTSLPFNGDERLFPADPLAGSWLSAGLPANTDAQQDFADQVVHLNWPNIILALVLVMLMLSTAIGNLFVIVAILIERNLRTIGNYLVLSLAIADLLVALLVMPPAGIYRILERWTLGVLLCDIWTSADVFCCTVTRVDYVRCQRNERRILYMILFVWITASVISLAPIFGWKDAQFEERITIEQECLLSQDVGYQIFATCTTFYFPLTLTLIFYWKIYQVARKRIRRKPGNRIKISLHRPSSSSSSSCPGKKLPPLGQQELKQQARHPGQTSNNKDGSDPMCLCPCHHNSQQRPQPIGELDRQLDGIDSYTSKGIDTCKRDDGCLSNIGDSASSLSSSRLFAASDCTQTANSGAPLAEEPTGNNGDNCPTTHVQCVGGQPYGDHDDRSRPDAHRPARATDNQISDLDSALDSSSNPADERQSSSLSGQTAVTRTGAQIAQVTQPATELTQIRLEQEHSPFPADQRDLPSGRIRLDSSLSHELGGRDLSSHDFGILCEPSQSGELSSNIPNCGQVVVGSVAHLDSQRSAHQVVSVRRAPDPSSRSPAVACHRQVKMYFSEAPRSIWVKLKARMSGKQSSTVTMLANMDLDSSSQQPATPVLVVDGKSLWPHLVDQTDCPMCSCRMLAAAASQPNGSPTIPSGDQADNRAAQQSSLHLATPVSPGPPSAAQAIAEGLESKRERKAAKTLAIITGVFVMCWLPFFVMAITMPLLDLRPHKYLFAFLLWLGYVNSMLNPIIYTIFSPDFRKAFKRLLCSIDVINRNQGQSISPGIRNVTTSRRAHTIGHNQQAAQAGLYLSVPSRARTSFRAWLDPILSRCCGSSSDKAMTASTNLATTEIGLTSNRRQAKGLSVELHRTGNNDDDGGDYRTNNIIAARVGVIGSEKIPAKVLGAKAANCSPRSAGTVINDF